MGINVGSELAGEPSHQLNKKQPSTIVDRMGLLEKLFRR